MALQRYQTALEAVTTQGVFEAVKRKVHPDQMVAVVVGKEKDFDRPLASAGLKIGRAHV